MYMCVMAFVTNSELSVTFDECVLILTIADMFKYYYDNSKKKYELNSKTSLLYCNHDITRALKCEPSALNRFIFRLSMEKDIAS